MVEQGKKRLADGQWIIMFPEGTRIPVGKQGKYKSGGARLAIETETRGGADRASIPANAGRRIPSSNSPGMITVSIGKPISPEGLNAAELMQQVENWIESEMRVISPQVYRTTSQRNNA